MLKIFYLLYLLLANLYNIRCVSIGVLIATNPSSQLISGPIFSMIDVAKEYVSIDPFADTRGEISALIAANDTNSLHSILGSRLEFGTAGLRGPMGGGCNRMNGLTIIQTTQGLARYLEEQLGSDAKTQGVVIGYDHRAARVSNASVDSQSTLSSKQFCRVCAAVFIHADFKVYLLEDLVPTPFVAFGVTHLNCCCGIMITASHNPKQDNGFKVYWKNGAQIISPHDSGISRHIDLNLHPWPKDGYILSDDFILGHTLVKNCTESVASAYCDALLTLKSTGDIAGNSALSVNSVKVAYTAMHGIGGKWIECAFSRFHTGSTDGTGMVQLLKVPSQFHPDPDFPTVVFPNPEEKGALNEAQQFAEDNHVSPLLTSFPWLILFSQCSILILFSVYSVNSS